MATRRQIGQAIESLIENGIMSARWLLVVFYGGLGLALIVYAVSFVIKFIGIASHVFDYSEEEMILAMLALIDAALVASLLVMVMISSYENYISRLEGVTVELSWLGKLDAGSLKIKVASSIVAISSIHLLEIFLNIPNYTETQIRWATLLHITFVGSALLLAVVDRISAKTKEAKHP
jgi:uncharacterized protein (TIGR00645 family)